MRNRIRLRSCAIAASILGLVPASARAAIFGVPTNLTAAGATQGTSVNPPGWFYVDGTGFADASGGDGVHQIRLFIEVTGTTLDIKVFDAGISGARDLTGTASTTTYTLLRPDGTTLQALTIGNEDGAVPTDDRLSRFSSTGAWTPASAGATFGGLSAGLYEFRVTSSGGTETNAFGVDIRSGAGSHYNVYTTAFSDTTIGTVGATESSMLIGALNTGTAPFANVTQPMIFYPYVNRGCSVQTSNFDMDNPGPGTGSTGTSTDTLAVATALTMGGGTVHAENAITVESVVANNLESINYGMFPLTNNSGTQQNTVDWRAADFQGWASNPADLPRSAVSPIRTYLPNGYAPVTGNPNATAPVEPILATSARLVSGPNPPVGGSTTRFTTTASVSNPAGGSTLSNVQITIGQPVNVVYAAGTQGGFVDGVAAACTDGSGATFRRCTFATLAAGSVASLNIDVDLTPPGAGLQNLTTAPAAATARNVATLTRSGATATATTSVAHGYQTGDDVVIAGANAAEYNGTFQVTVTGGTTFTYAVPGTPASPATGTITATEACLDSMACANYTPAFSSATFPERETLGPVCNLVVNAGPGSGVVPTRATLQGLKVNPAGSIEFAVGSQRDTAAFNVYAVADRAGRGPRIRLNRGPVPAPMPSSLTPILYRVDTSEVTAGFLFVEEIDLAGRRHFMGPFPTADPRLRESFDRLEARLQEAGLAGSARARFVLPQQARRLARARVRTQVRPEERRSGLGLKIEVETAGRVELSLAQLARDIGLPARAPVRVRLTNQGRDVPFDILTGSDGAPTGIAFTAEEISTDYTGRNAYILTKREVRPDLSVPLTRSEDRREAGYFRVETNALYVANAPPDSDPWLWDLLVGDGSTWPYDGDPGAFDLPGLAGGAENVPVRIRLLGRTPDRHSVEAQINGTAVGSVSFGGAVPALLEGFVPRGVLQPTGNRLTLVYSAAGSSGSDVGLAYLNYLELGLSLTPPAASTAVARLALYDPRLPNLGGVDYLILTHGLFREAAERIAQVKESEGHRTAVVDVERAYDRFSAGITEANALHALLQEATTASRRLRYVLLVGDDTFDPHDYVGTGAVSYVPSLLVWDGEFGRVPAENRYADLDGDGRPDLAIGRLPVQTPEEAWVLAEKIGRQGESLAESAGRHLFAVDNQAPGDTSFRGEAQVVEAGLPGGSTVAWSDVTDGVDSARNALFRGLREGAMVTHFFGHAGPQVWTDEGFLTVDDVAGLEGTKETVLFTWACEAQWYQYLFGDTINEALLLLPRGGALASFGPAGITAPAAQDVLIRRIYDNLFTGVTLGEAIRRAKVQALAQDPRSRVAVEGWNLIGDPALVFAGPRGGTGSGSRR